MDDYTASIEEQAPELKCKCGGCSWSGPFADLQQIDCAILTPGDASPAGRCPDCESLAYVIDQELVDVSAALDTVAGLAESFMDHWETDDGMSSEEKAAAAAARAGFNEALAQLRLFCGAGVKS